MYIGTFKPQHTYTHPTRTLWFSLIIQIFLLNWIECSIFTCETWKQTAKDRERKMKREKNFEILSHNEVASEAAITLCGIVPLYRNVLHSTQLPKVEAIPLAAVACLSIMTGFYFKYKLVLPSIIILSKSPSAPATQLSLWTAIWTDIPLPDFYISSNIVHLEAWEFSLLPLAFLRCEWE